VDFKAMEAKKVQSQVGNAPTTVAPSEFSLKKIAAYFVDVKAEFYRVTWTNREELRVYTWIVVAATFVLGLGVYAIDLAIQSVLALLGTLIRVLFG
jgi:preprotein translocase subunit SecE